MVFSTVLFLFRFLPITLALYYLAPARLKNTVLFLCSLVFYSWGEVRLFPVMAAAILINYTAGLGIERFKDSAAAPANLLIGIEAEGDIEEIIQATGSVATDTLVGDEPIDICQVVEGEKGISHFMIAHITPFYEKRWGSFLRDFKQNRII